MSVHQFPVADPRLVRSALAALGFNDPTTSVDPALPQMSGYAYDAGVLEVRYDANLTAAQITSVTEIVRATVGGLTRTERNGIEADLAAMRRFRQFSQADFLALTANQRDREVFDVANAQTNVLRALLRDA